VSDPVLFHRRARRSLDLAIHRAFTELRGDAATAAAFARLLDQVWRRSSLLRTTGGRSRERSLELVVNLARHHADHIRAADSWAGGGGSVHTLGRSLAQHLVGRHPVPPVLASAWYGGNAPAALAERRWYIEHGRGTPIRALPELPVRMTRRMEQVFLASPHHLSVRAALRRAEILALGGTPELVDAVLATDLGSDLAHGDFWRTVVRFLVRYWDEIGTARVAPIVDFLYAVRIRPVEVATANGPALLPPPDPGFSIAGRTPRSLARLVEEWHGELASRYDSGRSWRRAAWAGFDYCEESSEEGKPPVRWRIVELVHSAELRAEGRALHHCVASYELRCVHGISSIWSLRREADGAPARSIYTVEVDPRARCIVQIRGLRNRLAGGKPFRMIVRWAAAQRLGVSPTA